MEHRHTDSQTTGQTTEAASSFMGASSQLNDATLSGSHVEIVDPCTTDSDACAHFITNYSFVLSFF